MRSSTAPALALLVLSLPIVLAADAPENDLLKSRGLTRVVDTYLLDADARSADDVRSLARTRAAMEAVQRQRTAILADIARAESLTAQYDRDYQALSERLSKTRRNTTNYNEIVGQLNQRLAAVRESQRYAATREKDLKGLVDGQDDYIAALLKTSDAMEAAIARYSELAKDPDVQSALARLSETAKTKPKLGPSPAFAQRLDYVRKLRASVESANIPVDTTRGVPEVMVSLNDKPAEKMVFDSGASLICLNYHTAKAVGLEPGADAPVVKAKVASGKIVTARLMKLPTVRVGTFVARDVECAVMPKDAGDADNLLGDSFLEHFAYRMDLAAGLLHLSQVGPAPAIDAKPVASSKPLAATRPADSHPSTRESAKPVPVATGGDGEDLFPTLTGDTKNKDPDDGSIVLTNKNQKLVTAKTFAPPVTFRVTAMTDSTNLRLHYGDTRIIFNWEVNQTELRIDGPVTGNVRKPGKGKVKTNQYVDVLLTIAPDSLTLSVDGEQRARLHADFSHSDEPLTLNTMAGATMKVKAVRVVKTSSSKD